MVDQLESEIIGIIKNRVESEGGDGETALIVGDLTAATELTALGVDSLGLADIIWDVEQAYGYQDRDEHGRGVVGSPERRRHSGSHPRLAH
uniref:Nodulation protein F n=1 Tax=Rhizobium meliloti TaxID=382 RepID=NODF_RHIML|nr:RecName: Full=Nodulation protein F; AltName: Full=Host-specificity of nodulation protein A [Sinorhizobium meliloti]AAA26290.1 host-specificity of modulation protein A [Sinorhizobium meliloti]